MTKEIPLTKGKVALVDDVDYEFLMQWKWHYHSRGYAARSGPRGEGRKMFLMHRVIIGNPGGFLIDHVNQNRLDNRRLNLRACSKAENMRNAPARKGTSSFKGVSWSSKSKEWVAHIRTDKAINKFLGAFSCEKQAAVAWNEAALKYHGEFAYLNVIDDT